MQNPLLAPWTGPFNTPPLAEVKPEHFPPAYDYALAQHAAEIAAIAGDPTPPSFGNTVAALERSGALLTRVEMIFSNLTASDTNPALQEIERTLAPRMAQHWNAIYLNGPLFARLDAVYQARTSLKLTAEELRVVERYHLDFMRAGAHLPQEKRARFAAIGERLASLATQFSQNVLADEQAWLLPLDEAQLAGLPPSLRDAAAATAKERGAGAPYAVTLSRSEVESFLQFADDRELRETLFHAFVRRGTDNGPVIAEMVALREEKAKLLGYDSFAAFKLDDSMAKTPANARALLEQVWAPARAQALKERDALQALIAEEGGNFRLAPWDWRYYAEKLRARLYDFDEAMLRPYFSLERMIEAAFFTAGKLFGLSFQQRPDVPVYHPDVRVWEVVRENRVIGLFYGDYFARPSKQGGAWMSSLRDQHRLDGAQGNKDSLPIILNNCNFAKAEPCLLSFDDARTLFHEFGHALHGLLSQVVFPRLSGTNVARDFVELPSQLYEHWLEQPEVLTRFARHYQSGEAIPRDLLDKLLAARNFNQGFATVEFLASAFVDMEFHAGGAVTDAQMVEERALEKIGTPEEIAPRHAARHFGHIFGGDGYSAGYYAYLWAEVLDADGFGAFKEAGDVFDPATARRLYDYVYSAGGSRDFAAAYRAFRGRDPKVEALLEGRGLAA
ncbi:MAG: M3 family metallopeptidase [Alphaproteobacteria bacterium]|nr:M3 family metallopeptidase [Alphaproteobacteria bacterium]